MQMLRKWWRREACINARKMVLRMAGWSLLENWEHGSKQRKEEKEREESMERRRGERKGCLSRAERIGCGGDLGVGSTRGKSLDATKRAGTPELDDEAHQER